MTCSFLAAVDFMLHLRPRLDASVYIGLRRYFLTFCTSGRRHWFRSTEIVDAVHGQILHAAVEMQMEEIAYCFMPDHLHLLIEGCTETADCLAFVHRAKQSSGYGFARQRRERLWQPSFYDRILRDEESTLPFVRYTLDNPVRAGIAETVDQYPFLGSPRYTIREVLEAVAWRPSL